MTTRNTEKTSTQDVTDKVASSVENKEELKNEPIKETKSKKVIRKFMPDEQIECRSVTYGELLFPGKKSQLLYTWSNYGDVTYVEYQDLQALRSTNSPYLKDPLFVIEDEELIEQWPELKHLYSKIAVQDADDLFNLPLDKFKSAISSLPIGFKESIKNMASAKILDGTLDSLAKINAMDDILGFDLKFYIQ